MLFIMLCERAEFISVHGERAKISFILRDIHIHQFRLQQMIAAFMARG